MSQQNGKGMPDLTIMKMKLIRFMRCGCLDQWCMKVRGCRVQCELHVVGAKHNKTAHRKQGTRPVNQESRAGSLTKALFQRLSLILVKFQNRFVHFYSLNHCIPILKQNGINFADCKSKLVQCGIISI